MYRPLWSETILQEVGDGLEKKLKHTPEQKQRRIQAMRSAFPEAAISVPEGLCGALTCVPDERDRHVLAAAIRGGAHVIVTQNTKHFPEECLAQYNVLCHTPDDFLVHQFHLSAEQVLEKLDAQAAALHKERPHVIEKLKAMTPNFCHLVEQWSS